MSDVTREVRCALAAWRDALAELRRWVDAEQYCAVPVRYVVGLSELSADGTINLATYPTVAISDSGSGLAQAMRAEKEGYRAQQHALSAYSGLAAALEDWRPGTAALFLLVYPDPHLYAPDAVEVLCALAGAPART